MRDIAQYMLDYLSAHSDDMAVQFILALLLVDVAAFLGSILMVVFYRLRSRFANIFETRYTQVAQDALERAIADDGSPVDEAVRLIGKMPPKAAGALFLKYSRLIVGASRERLLRIFRRTRLTRWTRQSAASPQWWRKTWAIRLVELLPEKEGGKFIESVIDDRNPLVRMGAIQMAHIFHTPEIMRQLFGMLAGKQCGEVFMLKDTLTRMGTRISGVLNVFLAEEDDEAALVSAIEIADAIRDTSHRDALVKILRERNDGAQAAAAHALASIPDEDVSLELQRALRAENPNTRAMAAYALGKTGDASCLNPLLEAFQDPAYLVRYHCAAAIRSLGRPGMDALDTCRHHADPYVADMARYVLNLPEFAIGAAI